MAREVQVPMHQTGLQVLGYVRVSTGEQADRGAGLGAQRHAIEAECERRGWTLLDVEVDAGHSARSLKRPAIQHALERLSAGEVGGLVVSKLDRLSRSMIDFTAVMARARVDGWALVALDCAVDTTTPAGEAMANVLATFAQFERRLIGQRTREALAVKRAQGVQLGRPVVLNEQVATRIEAERATGASFAKIAAGLNTDGVPTAHAGKQWWPETVRGIVRRQGQTA